MNRWRPTLHIDCTVYFDAFNSTSIDIACSFAHNHRWEYSFVVLHQVEVFVWNFDSSTLLINHILKHFENRGKNDMEEGGSKADAEVEDFKPNTDAGGSGSGTTKRGRERRAKVNCEGKYSGAATGAEQKQMSHEVAMDVDRTPLSSTTTVFGDRISKKISGWSAEN
uniref:RRM domain-containing protein n=1 Tax=Parascaris univalens TaxID=6257 RepID=A0A915A1S5_PARUN